MSFLQTLTVHRLSLKLSTVAIVCLCLCSLGQRELTAQQILIRIGGGQNAKLEIYNQLNNIFEGKREAAKNRIESHLHDIDLACELSPKQRKRLEVAGKGAVVSYSNKILEKLKTQGKPSGFDFEPGNPPDVDSDEVQDEGNNARRGARVVNLGNGPNGEIKFTIETENVWVASIQKTLTAAQLEKLESWLSVREKLTQQAAVDHLIAKADLKMFLSRSQRQKLKAFVDQEYGPQLAQQMKMPPQPQRGFIVVGVPQPELDIEVNDSLKEFLTEPQLEIWKLNFQDDLDSIEGNGFGLRNFLGR